MQEGTRTQPLLLSPGMIIVILMGAACLVWGVANIPLWVETVAITDLLRLTYWGLNSYLWAPVFSNPAFYGGAFAILLCERVIPVHQKTEGHNKAFLVDFLWTVVTAVFGATVVAFYLLFLVQVFKGPLTGVLPQFAIAGPVWIEILIAYLLTDFIGWLHHLLRHKVKAYWQFHVMHHSQTRLNLFTTDRFHPIDFFIAQTIRFFPALMFEHTLEIVLAYLFFSKFQDRFYHSNIKTNLGWLRYVFVTPQSHRIHHSADPRHADCNFGVSLSVWDHLFGTQYRNYEEYPETGVIDPDLPREPIETEDSLKMTARLMWQQLAFPFKALMRDRG